MKTLYLLFTFILSSLVSFGQENVGGIPVPPPPPPAPPPPAIPIDIDLDLTSKDIYYNDSKVTVTFIKSDYDHTFHEPPLVLGLSIGDSLIILYEDQNYQISGNIEKVPIKINSANFKIFKQKKIEFAYPRQFYYKHDFGSGDSWSFVGDDFTLFYLESENYTSLEERFNELKKMFKKKKIKIVKTESIKRIYNDVELTGKAIELDLMGARFRQEILTFNEKSDYRYFNFSDYLDSNGNRSKEAKIAINLLEKSLKIKD